jgi:nucleotide-binding universal stress UspA family protein
MRWGAFMKMVVFVDGSKHSFEAVKIAAHIAKGVGASVTVLGIAPRYRDSEWVKSYQRQIKEETTVTMSRVKKIMDEVGVHPHFEILEDMTLLSVLDEVLSFIREGRFDLLVIGSPGLTGLKKFFFRGIGRDIETSIIENAPCSVLVVRG